MAKLKRYSKVEITAEYDTSSIADNEFDKVKWGSQIKMENRFRLALSKLPFGLQKKWLDIGCGTGAFQAMVIENNLNIEVVGLDISSKLINYASNRLDIGKARFVHKDFMDFSEICFDIITCIGVLQKTTFLPKEFFKKVREMLSDDGLLFVDTKNICWKAFNQKDFFPDMSHQWFRPSLLEEMAYAAGLKVIESGGFEPGTNKIVEINDSHTIFLILTRI